jgi:hypothetical protein
MELPRDPDGYIDLSQLPDDQIDFDISRWGSPERLSDDVWEVAVANAPRMEPESIGDIDDLLPDPSVAPPPADDSDGYAEDGVEGESEGDNPWDPGGGEASWNPDTNGSGLGLPMESDEDDVGGEPYVD